MSIYIIVQVGVVYCSDLICLLPFFPSPLLLRSLVPFDFSVHLYCSRVPFAYPFVCFLHMLLRLSFHLYRSSIPFAFSARQSPSSSAFACPPFATVWYMCCVINVCKAVFSRRFCPLYPLHPLHSSPPWRSVLLMPLVA